MTELCDEIGVVFGGENIMKGEDIGEILDLF